jgi:biopolymer transport protein ExbB
LRAEGDATLAVIMLFHDSVARLVVAVSANIPLQNDTSAVTAQPGGLWALFAQSFDLFTVLLLVGSVVGVALCFVCLLEVREKAIAPPDSINRLTDLLRAKRWEDARAAVANDKSVVAGIVSAAMDAKARNLSGQAIRDAAELAAGELSAKWFRRIDLLNIIGNLGPLVGLAGTVWGMILAFTSLGASGGQAGPADLSMGISKALFHTLLGLVLAIPCLLAYGLFRAKVDRLCTRALVAGGELVEEIANEHNITSGAARS